MALNNPLIPGSLGIHKDFDPRDTGKSPNPSAGTATGGSTLGWWEIGPGRSKPASQSTLRDAPYGLTGSGAPAANPYASGAVGGARARRPDLGKQPGNFIEGNRSAPDSRPHVAAGKANFNPYLHHNVGYDRSGNFFQKQAVGVPLPAVNPVSHILSERRIKAPGGFTLNDPPEFDPRHWYY